MPLIILIVMFVAHAVVSFIENNTCDRRSKPLTASDLNKLSRLMVGKFQVECKQILRTYKMD